tara:strand:- start:5333 stop:5953 length:621 start_codon:yes stop_codon:yes gene_type:complete
MLVLGMQNLGAMSFDFEELDRNSRIALQLVTNFAGGTLNGKFSTVVGNIEFPVEAPQKSSGRVELDARSIRFGFGKVTGDAHSIEWLNSAKFPRVSFVLEGMKDTRWEGKSLYATAFGPLSLKNKTIVLSIPLKIQYQRAGRRKYDGIKGDLLLIEGESWISRGDFGINPRSSYDSVLDRVLVKVQLVGASKRIRSLLPSALFKKE